MTTQTHEARNISADIGQLPDNLQGVIITDCIDANARVRQQVRFNSLFGITPTFVELGCVNPDLEAAGHLTDVLDAGRTPDAIEPAPSVVLVNVAPRGDDVREKWENGTPFSYVRHGNTTIVSAFEGRALALTKKLGLFQSANLLDIPEVTNSLVDDEVLSAEEADAIQNTQFRSLEFLPLAARLLAAGKELPAKSEDLQEHESVDNRAWFVDNFGNLKTTILPEEVDFQEGQTVRVVPGQEITFYRRLTDVPTGEFALTIGSSGYCNNRWLELVQQRGRAADKLELGVGSKILGQP